MDNYEKKYKDALDKMREWKKKYVDSNVLSADGTIVNDLKGIFPELAESDDEEIIRAIIDALYSHTNSINLLSSRGYQMENIKAWLEKQPIKKDHITPNEEFFQWIYDRLVIVHKENPNADYMISFKKRIEELSFDESHWKPSEEQMEALKYVNEYIFLKDSSKRLWLKTLYEDLKKL